MGGAGLDDYSAGPFGYLALVEKAKATLEIPVIASLNGLTPGASHRPVRDPAAWERARCITMLSGYPDQVHTEAR